MKVPRRHTPRGAGLLPLLVLALSAGGCIDIEQAIELREDLSGSARVTQRFDFESLAYMMAWGRNKDRGAGEPTPQQLEETMALITEKMADLNDPDKRARDRQDLVKQLPDGVSLASAESRMERTRGTVSLGFAFSDPTKIDVRLGSDRDSPLYRPFAGFRVRQEGADIVVSADFVNPIPRAREQSGSKWDAIPKAERDAFMARVLGAARVRCSLTAPFEIVEHNASVRSGRTLTWEFDYDDMRAMSAEESRGAISVRYRKP